ncbi:hypothetical protein LRY65_00705 [Candidatus Woesebacteria bacterium]|nr:hypothetical protein [Candidatus Woesebacteria bacterium]MCD8507205.1 hypothetical protein [Candidatus Woesebacteria bacterium]MCD8526719.1 hypothetical protein [Candidatus Woesebacteria bacterium]MCD8546538.1 hypothetical protein [Candidatus Woesebacteria bacterium]
MPQFKETIQPPPTFLDLEWDKIQKQLENDPRSASRREIIQNPDNKEWYQSGQEVPAKVNIGKDVSEFEIFSGRGWKIHLTVNRTSTQNGRSFQLGPNETRLLNYLANRNLYAKVEHGLFTYGHGGQSTGSTIYTGGINETVFLAHDIEQHLSDILSVTNSIIFPGINKTIYTGSGSDRYLVPSGKIVGRMELFKLNIPGLDYDSGANIAWTDVARLLNPIEDAQYMGIPLLPEFKERYQKLLSNWNLLSPDEKKIEFVNIKEKLLSLMQENSNKLSTEINRAFVEQNISNSGTSPQFVSMLGL